MKNKLDGELVVALVVTAGVCAACMFKDAKKRITKYFKTKKLESLRNRIEAEFQRWRKLTAESKKDRLLPCFPSKKSIRWSTPRAWRTAKAVPTTAV